MSVVLESDVLRKLEEMAELEHRTPLEMLADALLLYPVQNKPSHAKRISGIEFLMSIAGISSSGETDISQRDEEIRAAEVHPIRGWGVDYDDESNDDQRKSNEVEAT